MTSLQVFSILVSKLKKLNHLHFEKVDELPSIGEDNVIYLLPKTTGGFEEYIYLSENDEYEDLGSTDIDLSQYATNQALDILRGQLVDAINAESLRAQGVEEDLQGLLNEMQDAIEDLSSSLVELENEVGDLDVCIDEYLVNGGVGGYRKYNNGMMEQWGINTTNGLTTVELFTPFKDTNYLVFTNVRHMGNYFHFAYPIENGKFNCRAQTWDGQPATIQLQWLCKGRWK